MQQARRRRRRAAPPIVGTFDWRDALMYFVFVDRFSTATPRNNAPVGGVERPGQLPGRRLRRRARQKINDGYFDELGVNTLWITVAARQRRRRERRLRRPQLLRLPRLLAAATSTQTESRFGTEAELKALVDAAHAHGHQGALRLRDEPRARRARRLRGSIPTGSGRRQRQRRQTACAAQRLQLGRRSGSAAGSPLPARLRTSPQPRRARGSVDNAVDVGQATPASTASGSTRSSTSRPRGSPTCARAVTAEVEPTQQQRFYMVGETFDGNRDLIKSLRRSRRRCSTASSTSRCAAQSLKTLLAPRRHMSDLAGFLDCERRLLRRGR